MTNMETENMSDNAALIDWTKEEKYNLLVALREIGSQDCEQISVYVKTKTEDEIRAAINFYKKKIVYSPAITVERRKRKHTNQPVIPLASWAKVLSEHRNFEELQTETSTALRLIAEFEDKPLLCSEKIDFKKIYYMLADALEGKSLPDDKLIKIIFDKSMVETSMFSKSFIRTTAYKQALKSVTMSDKDINYFPKPILNNQHATLRHIAGQKNYNPLNIHESLLKSCAK